MQLMFDYAIRGRICVPEGSKLNNTETGIILPDGKEIKLWEKVEISTVGEDDHRDLEYDELEGMGIFYDGDCCELEGPVEDGDRVWPPTNEATISMGDTVEFAGQLTEVVGVPIPPPVEDVEQAECMNCGWNGGVDELGEIKGFFERVQPGDTAVPAGECPECSCLAYLKEDDPADIIAANKCPLCNSPLRREVFTGEHIDGEAVLWVCSQNAKFGGACRSNTAYFGKGDE